MLKINAGRTVEGFIVDVTARGTIGDIMVETAFALRDLTDQIARSTGDDPGLLLEAICAAVDMLPERYD